VSKLVIKGVYKFANFKFSARLLILTTFIISSFSCDRLEEKCSNYTLRKSYNLSNSYTDTETFEKINNSYFDNNKLQLDHAFDGVNTISLSRKSDYFKDRIHFKMNFENDMTGYFQDGNNDLSLKFGYNYIQDSLVTILCENDYQYHFFINEKCKLEHCVYVVTTFKNFKVENHKVVYTTLCGNKSYQDVAIEVLKFYGQTAPDTIGINQFTMVEN